MLDHTRTVNYRPGAVHYSDVRVLAVLSMWNIQNITEQFKGLSAEELLTIIAAATAEAKKAVKVVAGAPKEAKEKKGSMPSV